MVCAGLDGTVRFYDRRMLSVGAYDNVETVSILTDQSTKGLFATFSAANSEANTPTRSCNIPGNTVVSNKRITSLQYDNWGSQLLVSYQTDKIYLLDWRVIANWRMSFTSKKNKHKQYMSFVNKNLHKKRKKI